jgi:anti-sigma factor RsiW
VTACSAFEDRLLDYRDLAALDRQAVDAHLAGCPDCRDYLQMLSVVDAAFSSQLRETTLAPRQLTEIRERIASDIPVGRVTTLPEWLDFAAACAVCAFGYGLAWQSGLIAYLVSTLPASPN